MDILAIAHFSSFTVVITFSSLCVFLSFSFTFFNHSESLLRSTGSNHNFLQNSVDPFICQFIFPSILLMLFLILLFQYCSFFSDFVLPLPFPIFPNCSLAINATTYMRLLQSVKFVVVMYWSPFYTALFSYLISYLSSSALSNSVYCSTLTLLDTHVSGLVVVSQ